MVLRSDAGNLALRGGVGGVGGGCGAKGLHRVRSNKHDACEVAGRMFGQGVLVGGCTLSCNTTCSVVDTIGLVVVEQFAAGTATEASGVCSSLTHGGSHIIIFVPSICTG
jgi:hypothetical protein